MRGFGTAALKGTSYILGTVTGLAIAVPLTAAAFSAVPMTRNAPVAHIDTDLAMMQSNAVNRTAKGPRLDIQVKPVVGAHNTSVAVKSAPLIETPASHIDAATQQASAAPVAPARTMRATKGCSSQVGVTRSNLTTEELTICVADASMIHNIN